MKRTALLLAWPMVAAGQAVSDTAARPIDLATAVSMAQQNSPLAIQARGNIQNARAGIALSRAAYLPSLSFSATNGGNRASGTSFYSSSFGFGGRMELYDGGRRSAEVSQAKADLTASEAAEVAQRFDISFQVKQQYYNALAAREAEAAALSLIDQADSALVVATKKLKAGMGTRSDSLRALVTKSNAQLALLTARNNLQIANVTLTRLTGSQALVTANPRDTVDRKVPLPDSMLVAGLIEQAPTIREAEMRLSAAKVGIKAARAAYFPNVELGYSRGGSGSDQIFGLGNDPFQQTQGWTLSLGLPLFDNRTRSTALIRSRIEEENANAQAKESRLLVRQVVTQSLAQMRIAEQQIELAQATIEAAEEDVRAQTIRFGLNVATSLDVITSLTQLDQARADLIRARLSYRTAKAQLEAAIGRDL
jgi:outer membrane protein